MLEKKLRRAVKRVRIQHEIPRTPVVLAVRGPHVTKPPTFSPPDFDAAPLDAGEADLSSLAARLITRLGEDVSREGLVGTPERVARSLRYLMSGYDADVHTAVNGALFKAEGAEMVIVKEVEFYSLCEHHMLPFFGHVHLAYVPGKTILGLSKFARLVDMFARRMQVQERLTAQLADALEEILAPKGVAVVSEASHLCMMMRGVEKQGSTTRASVMRGAFKEDAALRREFLDAL